MTKPSRKFLFDTLKTRIEEISNGLKTNGFGLEEVFSSKNANDIFALISDWLVFVAKSYGETVYVAASGSDTTGDGTSDKPFQTIKKASDSIEDGGFGFIVAKEAGTYHIGANIDLTAKSLIVTRLTTGTAANILFDSYVDSDENDLYRFNLYAGSNLFISMENVSVGDPANVAKEWKANCACIMAFDGLSTANVYASTDISFSNTAAASLDYLPALFMPFLTIGSNRIGIPAFGFGASGNITTNSKGYILDANSTVCILNKLSGTIDQVNYYVREGQNHVKNTLISGVIGDTSGSGTVLSCRSGSETITVAEDTPTTLAKLKNLMTDAYGLINADHVTGVKLVVGGKVVGIQIIIEGSSAGVVIGDIKSTADTTSYLDVVQGHYRKNNNILSNIEELYQ